MKRIILSLDNVPTKEALKIAKKVKGKVWGFKLRRQIFESGIGIISEFKQYGSCMTDFKFFDIPSAMNEAIQVQYDNGADITTVHCSASYRPESLNNMIAGVTVLTSMAQNDFRTVYNTYDLAEKVLRFVNFANKQNYGYIVCSPKEISSIRNCEIDINIISPGIRPNWFNEAIGKKDDQVRISTPAAAINAGATFLVIGRPLLNSDNICKVIDMTNKEIEEAENE